MYTEEAKRYLFENYALSNVSREDRYIDEVAGQVLLLHQCKNKVPDYINNCKIQEEVLLNEVESVAEFLDNTDMDIALILTRLARSKFDPIVLTIELLRYGVDPLKLVRVMLDVPDLKSNYPYIKPIKFIKTILDHSKVDLSELVDVLLDVRFEPVNPVNLVKLIKIILADKKLVVRHIELVKTILSHPQVEITAEDSFAIRYAARYGHCEVVTLLLNDVHVSPADRAGMYDLAIEAAAKYGQIELMEILLNIKELFMANNYIVLKSISDVCEFAIQLAASNGQVEVVKFLLNKVELFRAELCEFAIQCAAEYDHIEVIKMLLDDYKVDKALVMKIAIQEDSIEVIKMLLLDYYLSPYCIIEAAIKENKMKIVKSVLDDASVNLGVIVEYAAQEGHVKVLMTALNRPRLNIRDGMRLTQNAMKVAATHGQMEIVNALIDYISLENRVELCDLGIKYATQNRQSAVITALETVKAKCMEKRPVSASLGKFTFWQGGSAGGAQILCLYTITPPPKQVSPR